MRYLLYCILGSLESQSPIVLVGVDGQPVCLVSNNGLSAAVSRVNEATITPEISRLLAYKQVIETFHNDPAIGGVIPMRYGCVLEERSQVIQILRKRRVKYIALLKELESCVEMGIRILISDCGFRISDSTENRNSKIENPQWKTPGHTYLGARKAYYAQEEKFNKQVEQVTERCCSAFNGLFKKYKTEFPSIANFQFSIFNPQSAIRNPFPYIYFLVPRNSVDPFRHAFQHLTLKESTKLLLSGPWPPYNFVQLEYSDRMNR
jgi:hypothetical protein